MATREYLRLVEEAQKQKINIANETKKKIVQIYEDTAENLAKTALDAGKGSLTERWAVDYKKSINTAIKNLNDDLYDASKDAARKSSEAANSVQQSYFTGISDKFSLGLDKTFKAVLSRVPEEAMNEILSGKMYRDRKGLSERIWLDSKEFSKDIDYILARGIAEKKSVHEFVKDLDCHVNPKAMKPWDYSKVYPNLRLQVDYNSQRIARTSINHAFFMANKRSCEGNPFIQAMHWALSGNHYERQVLPWGEDICDDYTKQNDYELGEGNFPINAVPVPHPHCLCSQYAVIPKSMEEIAEELRAWVNGENNDGLDKWLGEGKCREKVDKSKESDIIDILAKGYTNNPEYQKWIVESIVNSTEEYKSYMIGHMEKLNVLDVDYAGPSSHYSPMDNIIRMTKNKNKNQWIQTFKHEFGHFFDRAAIDEQNSKKYYSGLCGNQDTEFFNAVEKYKIMYSKNSMEAKLWKANLKHTFETNEFAYNNIAFSDCMSGLTKANISGGWGHSPKYWKDRPIGAQREIFANLFQAYADNDEQSIELFKKYVPEIVDGFNKLLEGVE